MIAGAPEQQPAGQTGNHLSYRIAKAIMGEDRIIGPDRVERDLGVVIDTKDRETADKVPYLPETLARYCKTHILVFGYPIVMKDIVDKSQQFSLRWQLSNLPDEEPAMLTTSPSIGWFLIPREVQGPVDEKIERLATAVEIFYAMSLYKKICKRHFFFGDKGGYGICNETPEGGEVYFGLGSAFTFRYDKGSYDYWVMKVAPQKTDRTIKVVLPDNPI